jgi:hypothetical protein
VVSFVQRIEEQPPVRSGGDDDDVNDNDDDDNHGDDDDNDGDDDHDHDDDDDSDDSDDSRISNSLERYLDDDNSSGFSSNRNKKDEKVDIGSMGSDSKYRQCGSPEFDFSVPHEDSAASLGFDINRAIKNKRRAVPGSDSESDNDSE